MTTFVLIPGAGDSAWTWRPVVEELGRRGHEAVVVDLPCDDDSAGLAEYVDVAVAAIGSRTGLTVVAHSLGAFTGVLLCERAPVDLLVLVAAMVPAPGESPGDWWANTRWAESRQDVVERYGRSPEAIFMHDVPPALAAEEDAHGREQSGTPLELPLPMERWPDVPTRFLLCTEDRFFPADFQRRVVRERLGITPDEMGGGHLPMLSRPIELVDYLESLGKHPPLPAL
jgi:pimeloyl-ACP methyl ester carboxylesterase